jgi:hypothetical protein
VAEDDRSEDRPGGFEPPPGAPPPAWQPTPPPAWSPPPPPTFQPPDIPRPQPPPGVAPPEGSPPASSDPPPAGQQQPPPPPPSPAPYSPPPGAPPPAYGQGNPYGQGPPPPAPGGWRPPPPPTYGYGPQFPQQGWAPQPYVARKTNGFAIASLILGVLWMYWVGSILALIFGYIGKNQIDNSNNTQDGRGLAIAGIVLGWIGVAVLAIIIVVAVASSGS